MLFADLTSREQSAFNRQRFIYNRGTAGCFAHVRMLRRRRRARLRPWH